MAWAPDYADADELAAYLRISDDLDADTLALAVTAASRAIDQATGRQFGQVATAELRTYPARYDRVRRAWLVTIDDLQSTDDLVVEQDGTAITDYELAPRNAAAKGQAWTELWLQHASATPDVEVTGKWGWAAIPSAVHTACLMQAARLFARRDAPFGVAGSPDMGSEMRLLAKIDPDVEVTLRAYRRWWGAV